MTNIKVVDLFAGPGGLGEGFSRYSTKVGQSIKHPFRIVLSAEKESSAHSTLTLRGFVRRLRENGNSLREYYAYVRGNRATPFTDRTASAWNDAVKEAVQMTLGTPEADRFVMDKVRGQVDGSDRKWVLIGGPPCQAYSVIGRSRNQGNKKYVPEDDHRHFLYRTYLGLLAELHPPVFLLENVKGMLTSRVSGNLILPSILRDLSDPAKATGMKDKGPTYRIHSLSSDEFFEPGHDPHQFDPNIFVVRAERHGIPQTRHRVILLGVRNDIPHRPRSLDICDPPSLWDVIGKLPMLRSAISPHDDSGLWAQNVKQYAQSFGKDFRGEDRLLSEAFVKVANEIDKFHAKDIDRGGRFVPCLTQHAGAGTLGWWIGDKAMSDGVSNHEAKSHMVEDLRRYLFAATFAQAYTYSPRGSDFPDVLAPQHKSWSSGAFNDRFRVQIKHEPSKTITSHLAKDGHYYIHPDPIQCRSLTVREAARLQTFPDNYFFEGTRTQQYIQVGNAVPPLLGRMIAERVCEIMK